MRHAAGAAHSSGPGADDLWTAIPFSQLLIPRLTAVEVDMFDMGWEAARFLVQKIKKPGLQVQTFCTTPRLLEGQST